MKDVLDIITEEKRGMKRNLDELNLININMNKKHNLFLILIFLHCIK